MSESSRSRLGGGWSEDEEPTNPTSLASQRARRGLDTSDQREALHASRIDSNDRYRMGTPGNFCHFRCRTHQFVQTKQLQQLGQRYGASGIMNGKARALVLEAFSPCLLGIDRSIEFQDNEIKARQLLIAKICQEIEWGEVEGNEETLGNFLKDVNKAQETKKLMADLDASFGTLFAGGGLRQDAENFPTDWVLIAPIAGRICENIIPLKASFDTAEIGYVPHAKIAKRLDSRSLTVPHPSNKDEPGGEYTLIDICPPGKNEGSFSELGDSGSAILDNAGNWAGIMFGATTPLLGQGAGKGHRLVVPMANIVADIETLTGYRVSMPQ
ncbi:MAG: hypothetical protein MMC33_003808 [Icmadophila ericetorum]|nr:hypothetical protein [Icmadophila ericetorum]